MPYQCAAVISQALLLKHRQTPNPLVPNSYTLAIRPPISWSNLASGSGRARGLGQYGPKKVNSTAVRIPNARYK